MVDYIAIYHSTPLTFPLPHQSRCILQPTRPLQLPQPLPLPHPLPPTSPWLLQNADITHRLTHPHPQANSHALPRPITHIRSVECTRGACVSLLQCCCCCCNDGQNLHMRMVDVYIRMCIHPASINTTTTTPPIIHLISTPRPHPLQLNCERHMQQSHTIDFDMARTSEITILISTQLRLAAPAVAMAHALRMPIPGQMHHYSVCQKPPHEMPTRRQLGCNCLQHV